jgi:hypothetical protein
LNLSLDLGPHIAMNALLFPGAPLVALLIRTFGLLTPETLLARQSLSMLVSKWLLAACITYGFWWAVRVAMRRAREPLQEFCRLPDSPRRN